MVPYVFCYDLTIYSHGNFTSIIIIIFILFSTQTKYPSVYILHAFRYAYHNFQYKLLFLLKVFKNIHYSIFINLTLSPHIHLLLNSLFLLRISYSQRFETWTITDYHWFLHRSPLSCTFSQFIASIYSTFSAYLTINCLFCFLFLFLLPSCLNYLVLFYPGHWRAHSE